MRDAPRERMPGGMVWLVLVLIVLMPVLYVLSIGPVAYLYEGSDAPNWPIVYRPLIWFGSICTPFDNLLSKYLVWWMDLAEQRRRDGLR